jgi:1-acyl-sn-glycerol-3-phosphate acyltransferase
MKRERTKTSKRADGSYSRAWRRFSKILLVPLIPAMMKRDWHGQQNFPAEGGMILAANHLSYMDIFAMALYSYQAGRYPVFLAKSTLFDIPVLGAVIRKLGQLPVHRNAADAALVLRDAEAGIRNGVCVIFYPEATVTRDPAQWPMVAKTGAARLALTTGAPVVPVAHWGAQDILPYHSYRPRLVPRKTVHALAGPPVDLSAFQGQPLTSKVLHAATEAIMKDITGLLAQLRGEVPPAEPFHPAVARRKARQELRQLQEDQPVTDGSDNSGPAADSSPTAATPATPAIPATPNSGAIPTASATQGSDATPDSGSTQAAAP